MYRKQWFVSVGNFKDKNISVIEKEWLPLLLHILEFLTSLSSHTDRLF